MRTALKRKCHFDEIFAIAPKIVKMPILDTGSEENVILTIFLWLAVPNVVTKSTFCASLNTVSWVLMIDV